MWSIVPSTCYCTKEKHSSHWLTLITSQSKRCYSPKRRSCAHLVNQVSVSRSVVPDSLPSHGLQPTRLLCPWDFPGKDTGVGCHFLLQGIFPTQGSNPGLLYCRQILYQLSYKESSGSCQIPSGHEDWTTWHRQRAQDGTRNTISGYVLSF